MNGIIEGMDGIDLRHKLDNKYNDIVIPITSLSVGASAPSLLAFNGDIYQMGFSGAAVAMNQVFGAFEMLHGWKEGTSIEMHVHWGTLRAATANTVRWNFQYTRANPNQTFTTTAGLTVTTTPSGARKHQYASLGTIAMTNYTIGSIIAFRFWRDAALDVFTSTAFAFSLGCHYVQDGLGSNSRASKY